MEEASFQADSARPAPRERLLVVAALDAEDRAALSGGLELAAAALEGRLIELGDAAGAIELVRNSRELGAFPALLLGSVVDDEAAARAARLLGGGTDGAPVVRWCARIDDEALERLLDAGCCEVVDRRRGTTDDLVRALRLAFEISRRRWAEAQLAHRGERGLSAGLADEARRLVGTGRLLLSASHDLNNLLQPLIGALELLAARRTMSDENAGLLAVAERSARLAAILVDRTLRLGHGRGDGGISVQPDRVLDDLGPLLRALAGAAIRLDLVLMAPGVSLSMGEGALEQIVLNLVANARDAMPDGGRLTLRSRRAATRWCLEVEDDGLGIGLDAVERAFDAGYTTKAGRDGAGLGLTIVRELVREAGGTVGLERLSTHGTRARVLVPVATPP